MPKKKRILINVSGEQFAAALEKPKQSKAKPKKRNWKKVVKKP